MFKYISVWILFLFAGCVLPADDLENLSEKHFNNKFSKFKTKNDLQLSKNKDKFIHFEDNYCQIQPKFIQLSNSLNQNDKKYEKLNEIFLLRQSKCSKSGDASLMELIKTNPKFMKVLDNEIFIQSVVKKYSTWERNILPKWENLMKKLEKSSLIFSTNLGKLKKLVEYLRLQGQPRGKFYTALCQQSYNFYPLDNQFLKEIQSRSKRSASYDGYGSYYDYDSYSTGSDYEENVKNDEEEKLGENSEDDKSQSEDSEEYSDQYSDSGYVDYEDDDLEVETTSSPTTEAAYDDSYENYNYSSEDEGEELNNDDDDAQYQTNYEDYDQNGDDDEYSSYSENKSSENETGGFSSWFSKSSENEDQASDYQYKTSESEEYDEYPTYSIESTESEDSEYSSSDTQQTSETHPKLPSKNSSSTPKNLPPNYTKPKHYVTLIHGKNQQQLTQNCQQLHPNAEIHLNNINPNYFSKEFRQRHKNGLIVSRLFYASSQ